MKKKSKHFKNEKKLNFIHSTINFESKKQLSLMRKAFLQHWKTLWDHIVKICFVLTKKTGFFESDEFLKCFFSFYHTSDTLKVIEDADTCSFCFSLTTSETITRKNVKYLFKFFCASKNKDDSLIDLKNYKLKILFMSFDSCSMFMSQEFHSPLLTFLTKNLPDKTFSWNVCWN